MGYWAISQISQDYDLTSRVQACAAQEVPNANPISWASDHMLKLAAEPGWSEAWESALAAGNENPGKDESVITDAMILSAIQAMAGAE